MTIVACHRFRIAAVDRARNHSLLFYVLISYVPGALAARWVLHSTDLLAMVVSDNVRVTAF